MPESKKSASRSGRRSFLIIYQVTLTLLLHNPTSHFRVAFANCYQVGTSL